MIADAAKQGLPVGEPEELDSTGQMSFLEHLDELRRRLVHSVIIIVIAFFLCWIVSGYIYNFLSAPVVAALAAANRRETPETGITGTEKVLPLRDLKVGDQGRYVFPRATRIGAAVVPQGATVNAVVTADSAGALGLFTAEEIFTSDSIIPKGVRLPVLFDKVAIAQPGADERLTVTTVPEQFTLFVTVSMYAAIAISIPLLLFQIWAFISPGLYKHERAYVTPFIALSSTAFVIGAAFAYYILLPPALKYLLGIGGGEFQLLFKASDYLDFVMLVMLAMGVIFQMPAITYVLARIGLVTAGFLIRSWKVSLIIILIVAAVVSPTSDIPNMMLFAAPMMVLYVVSIFIAWFFGKKRQTDSEAKASGDAF